MKTGEIYAIHPRSNTEFFLIKDIEYKEPRRIFGLHIFQATDTKKTWTVIEFHGEDFLPQPDIAPITMEGMKKCIKILFNENLEIRE